MKLLKKIFTAVTALIILSTPVNANPKDPALNWENDINTFMQWDSKNSFPKEAILFVGSSSIRYWKTRECFPKLQVINRGFGGSQVSDLLYYFDKLVLKYKPRAIVLYSGDNDIAVGKKAETVANDYKIFINRCHEKLPNTPIIIIPIKPSRARWNLWPEMAKTNTILQNTAAKDKLVHMVNCAAVLMTKEQKPDDSCFLDDKLHLSKKGYKLWTDLINTKLAEVFATFEEQPR